MAEYECAYHKEIDKTCSADCEMRPYFPVNRGADYRFLHEFFGYQKLRRLIRIARARDPEKVLETVGLLVKVARDWHDNPLRGHYEKIDRLKNDVAQLQSQVAQLSEALKNLSGCIPRVVPPASGVVIPPSPDAAPSPRPDPALGDADAAKRLSLSLLSSVVQTGYTF